jgi:CelD/BcsL family acetyltransferase involved in cellulose biosynthesis
MTRDAVAPLSFELVSDFSSLQQLKPEWDALWLRAGAPAYLSFAYAAVAFEACQQFSGQRPHCLVGRTDRRLALLWPLMRHRSARLWRTLRPLGPDAAEECDILTEPGEEAARRVDAAWTALLSTADADRLLLPFLRDGTPLQATLKRRAGGRLLTAEPYQTWSLAWPSGQTWQDWYDGLSGSYRRAQRKKRAILARSGGASFDLFDHGEECAAIIDMMLEWKRHWARHAKPDKAGRWLHEQGYAKFLKSFLANGGAAPRPYISVLRLDGRVVAALVIAVGPTRIDWIISSFDPIFASASPGMALYEHALQWAHARGLSINFGVGGELNKRYWCDHKPHGVTSYTVGLSRWGVVGHQLGQLRKLASHPRASEEYSIAS